MNRIVLRWCILAIVVTGLVACSDHAKEFVVGPKFIVRPDFALATTPPAAVLDTSTIGNLTVTSSALSAPVFAQDGLIGPPVSGLPGRTFDGVIIRVAFYGCDASNFAGFPAGTVALIARGGCPFSLKAANAEAAGAVGVVVYQRPDLGDTLVTMIGSPVGIPAVFIGNTAGLALKAATPVWAVVSWSPIEELSAWVGQLEAAGLLKGGQAKSLSKKLDHATSAAEAGQDSKAVKELNAFIKEVQKLLEKSKPVIAESDGLALINQANSIIAALTP